MRSLKIACTLACLLLSVAAPLDAQEASPRPSPGSPINDARTLIDGGDFTEALSILRPLAPGNPDRPEQLNVLFLLGLAALGEAQRPETPELERKNYLDEAIGVFHRILVASPELVRVRLELARAFFLKRDDGLSRKNFERVLAENPPPPVAANIRSFLAVIRARRRWSGYFGTTLAPDTNLNAASDSDENVIELDILGSRLPFRLQKDEEGARSGVGVAMWGGGEYEYPLSPNVQLRAGGGVSRTEYSGQDFDQMSISAHGGPRWSLGNRTEINLLGSARRGWSAGEPQFKDLGARFDVRNFLGRRVLLRTQASYHQRSYDEDIVLDGPRSDVSLTGIWQATPIMRLEASVGLAREQTEDEDFRNSRQSVGLGASIDLPRGFTVGINGLYRWTDYDGLGGRFPLSSGETRSDGTRTLRFSMYNRGFTIQGFSPKVVLIREKRESNAPFNYRKTRAEVQFVRVL